MAEDEKKKKKPGLIEMGKRLYGAYMARRKQMSETRPRLPKFGEGGIKRAPAPEASAAASAATEEAAQEKARAEAEKKRAQAEAARKKKKPRGGVGGVLDAVQERKRRMEEALGD